jgi:hypothetical protein
MIGGQREDLESHFAWGNMCSPLLESKCEGPVISASWRPLVSGQALLLGCRMLHGGGSIVGSAAKRPACAWLCSLAGSQGSGSSVNLPWRSTCSSLPSIGNVPPSTSPHAAFPCVAPFCPSRWQVPAAFLPAPAGRWGRGWPRPSGASFSLTRSCISGISQQQVLRHCDKHSCPQ